MTGRPVRDSASPWLRLSVVTAAVAGFGSIIGLLAVDSVYGKEADSVVDQAIAQDLVNLIVVTPGVVLLVWLALRGSLGAYLAWLGLIAFTVYNYVIYAFALQFGPLFLLWCAVLGASVFALAGGMAALNFAAVRDAFGARSLRGTAGFLVFVGAATAALWLSDIVPALIDGSAPESVQEAGFATSPVHVLDLSVLLPAVIGAGVQLWRRRPFGYATAVPLLLVLALFGVPIVVTPFVTAARGGEPAWEIIGPLGVLTVACTAVAARMLTRLR